MKKIIVSFCALLFCSASFSQPVYYAAAKAGLSMREQPGTAAKILEKIPYGEKPVIVANTEPQVAITEFEIYLLDTQAVIFYSSGV